MPMRVAEERFRALVFGGAVAGVIVHVAFLATFVAIEAKTPAAITAGALALFALCGYLARRAREPIAGGLIAGVVLGHAAVAVWFFGWASGFHYYVFCLIPPVTALPRGGTARRVLFLVVCTAVYLGVDLAAGATAPLIVLEPALLDGLRALNIVASAVILGYLVLSLQGAILRAEARLTDIATTDLLSGLYTRRYGLTLITREMEHARRNKVPLTFVLADVDGFKAVNDRHGHETGDRLLSAIGQRLQAGVRKGDLIVRWGGDEFLLILPGQNGAGARATAERMQLSVAGDPVLIGDLEIRIGMTCGVTEYAPGDTIADCLRTADAALYDGKRLGGNQVIAALPMASPQSA